MAGCTPICKYTGKTAIPARRINVVFLFYDLSIHLALDAAKPYERQSGPAAAIFGIIGPSIQIRRQSVHACIATGYATLPRSQKAETQFRFVCWNMPSTGTWGPIMTSTWDQTIQTCVCSCTHASWPGGERQIDLCESARMRRST